MTRPTQFCSWIKPQFFDDDGVVLAGGKIGTYIAGTSTQTATYSDRDGNTANTNPVVLDASGRADIFLDSSIRYKFIVMDADDVPLYTVDDVYMDAGDIEYDPVVTYATGSVGDAISDIEDAISDIEDVIEGGAWLPGPTPTYVSATSFTVVGNYTSTFQAGRRLKFAQSGDIFGSVQSASFGGGVTTVVVAMDSTALSGSLTALEYSMLESTHTAVPAYLGTATGEVPRLINSKMGDFVSVKDFGAVGDGATDDSAAFLAAFATSKMVYVPKGTYTINVTCNYKLVMVGDGNTYSIIRPLDTTYAAITYKPGGAFNYHAEVRDVGFAGTGKVGVGFTFGATSTANYTEGDEFAGNVKFYGCNFTGLDKGVQFPFGNIGTEFYSCGYGGNRYGVYTINNKTGQGSAMHAGNKYFYAGEFHSNDCAFYCDNSQDGFGGVGFTDTIFESNHIDIYLNNQSGVMITPLTLNNVWFEDTIPGAVTIDSWSGNTATPQSVAAGIFVLDGTTLQMAVNNGFFSDCRLNATKSHVTVSGCRSERSTGVGGKNSVVLSSDSSITQIDCYGDLGPSVGYNVFSTGHITVKRDQIETDSATNGTRFVTTKPCTNKTTGLGVSLVKAVTFTSPEAGTGSFSQTGTVVAGGVTYPTCNNYARTAAGTESFSVTSTSITTAATWYVVTFDAMVEIGNSLITFAVWDRNTTALAIAMSCPTANRWYTFAAYGQSTGGSTLYLDATLTAGEVVWNVSAYQIHKFATMYEAQNFMTSRTYVPS